MDETDQARRRNADTVQRMYQAERERDLATWVTLWSPQGRQSFPTMGPETSVSGLQELMRVTAEKFATRPPYGIRDTVSPMADPRLVLARVDLDFPDRPTFPIWCLFHFDEDGLIAEVEEMVDRGSPAARGSDGEDQDAVGR